MRGTARIEPGASTGNGSHRHRIIVTTTRAAPPPSRDRRSFSGKSISEPSFTARKSAKFADLNLPVSGLYLLAQPSTPEEARDEVTARAENRFFLPACESGRSLRLPDG
jgi:hypothetical protein